MFSRQNISCLELLIVLFVSLLVGALFLKGAMLLGENFKDSGISITFEEDKPLQEGIVVDKDYTEGYSYVVTTYIGSAPIFTPVNVSASYRMKISGEVNGEKVEKKIYVSEEEYNSYKVGDTYKFK